MEAHPRKPYPSDVSDEEWLFVAPYLTLMDETAPQRRHDLREVFNGLRFIARTGLQWRQMPHDLPPWPAVYQQTRRWLACDYELLLATVARLHFLAFACLQLHRLVPLLAESSWQALVRVKGAHERSGMAADASRCRRSRVCRARRL